MSYSKLWQRRAESRRVQRHMRGKPAILRGKNATMTFRSDTGELIEIHGIETYELSSGAGVITVSRSKL